MGSYASLARLQVPATIPYPEPDRSIPWSQIPVPEDQSDLYRFLTFHGPKSTSLSHCLGRTKVSVQVRCPFIRFVTRPVLTVRGC